MPAAHEETTERSPLCKCEMPRYDGGGLPNCLLRLIRKYTPWCSKSDIKYWKKSRGFGTPHIFLGAPPYHTHQHITPINISHLSSHHPAHLCLRIGVVLDQRCLWQWSMQMMPGQHGLSHCIRLMYIVLQGWQGTLEFFECTFEGAQ